MYNNEYPVRYPFEDFNNQETSYDYYGTPPGNNHPYPKPESPCTPMPPMPPMPYPPNNSTPPMPCPPHMPMPPMPCPPHLPKPPIDMMPGHRMQCMMHMKDILEKLMNKKASLVIEGARGKFECAKIVKMDDCFVMAETKAGICVIPYHEITAICMSKEVAKDIMDK